MTLATVKDYLASVGCSFPEIGLLQPADPFLDTTGEDLRRRIFITSENSGTMLCLRPEFTVPVCMHHLENGNGHGRYAYGGVVFRQRTDAPSEFVQAGFEDLGNTDRSAADTDCINTASGLLRACGVGDATLVLGDQSAFTTLLEALEVPYPWRKKLLRAFGDNQLLNAHIAAMSREAETLPADLPSAIAEAIAQSDPEALLSAVTETMLADGLPLTGGRTPSAIAERLMENAVVRSSRLEDHQRQALEAFLGIDTGLDEAAGAIEQFEKTYDVSLTGIAEKLSRLASRVEQAGGGSRYRASFGRRLDYYTGLVFEFYRPGADRPVIGGGRYDHLMTLLGSASEIPAVGFAVWLERLEGPR